VRHTIKSGTVTDWVALKKDYLNGKIPQIEIARKYGCSPANISQKVKREGWKKFRIVKRKPKASALAKINKQIEARMELIAKNQKLKIDREYQLELKREFDICIIQSCKAASNKLKNYLEKVPVNILDPVSDVAKAVIALKHTQEIVNRALDIPKEPPKDLTDADTKVQAPIDKIDDHGMSLVAYRINKVEKPERPDLDGVATSE
jgi:flagellar hook-basal body complex protein FliE